MMTARRNAAVDLVGALTAGAGYTETETVRRLRRLADAIEHRLQSPDPDDTLDQSLVELRATLTHDQTYTPPRQEATALLEQIQDTR